MPMQLRSGKRQKKVDYKAMALGENSDVLSDFSQSERESFRTDLNADADNEMAESSDGNTTAGDHSPSPSDRELEEMEKKLVDARALRDKLVKEARQS